jgi:cobyrinic acid a,c-diamide synthase
MSQREWPRIVITALKGGAGKTIASLGLVRAWRNHGQSIVPFKKGPDYIDAAWLGLAAGRPCYNLDPFLMSRQVIRKSFTCRAKGAEISIIEGNRGLFDGVDEAGTCSTGELAKWLDAPVVLVLDCTKMTRTAAALVLGCQTLDPEVRLEGVILNHVARSRHETIVRRAIESYTGLPVLGALPRMKKDPLPMRHLGVTPCQEHPQANEALETLGQIIREHIDIHAVGEIASRAGGWEFGVGDVSQSPAYGKEPLPSGRLRIGVIRDEAFQFYYPENLEALETAGAELVFINSIHDTELPEIDALYIGGGFPETQAARLSANEAMREGIRSAAHNGLPIYAECGGLMYLGRRIVWQGQPHPMTGILGWDFVVGNRPVGHGYSILEVTSPNPFYEKGVILQGHEFHYSRPVPAPGQETGELTCRVVRGHGFNGKQEGATVKNVFGTYTHIHALERPDWAGRMVMAAYEYRQSLSPQGPEPVPTGWQTEEFAAPVSAWSSKPRPGKS